MDTSSIALGEILSQPREGDIDHPIDLASRKISIEENNYTNLQWEGLVMVYVL